MATLSAPRDAKMRRTVLNEYTTHSLLAPPSPPSQTSTQGFRRGRKVNLSRPNATKAVDRVRIAEPATSSAGKSNRFRSPKLQDTHIPVVFFNQQEKIPTQASPRQKTKMLSLPSWETTLFPSLDPDRREQVIQLREQLADMLSGLQSNLNQLTSNQTTDQLIEYSSKEWRIYEICLQGLITQINFRCKDRGDLLNEVRERMDEAISRLVSKLATLNQQNISHQTEVKTLQRIIYQLEKQQEHSEEEVSEMKQKLQASQENFDRYKEDQEQLYEDLESKYINLQQEQANAPLLSLRRSTEAINEHEGANAVESPMFAYDTAAIIIQHAFRKHRNRSNDIAFSRVHRQHQAAIMFQRFFRGRLNEKKKMSTDAVVRILMDKDMKCVSIRVLQRAMRRFMERRRQKLKLGALNTEKEVGGATTEKPVVDEAAQKTTKTKRRGSRIEINKRNPVLARRILSLQKKIDDILPNDNVTPKSNASTQRNRYNEATFPEAATSAVEYSLQRLQERVQIISTTGKALSRKAASDMRRSRKSKVLRNAFRKPPTPRVKQTNPPSPAKSPGSKQNTPKAKPSSPRSKPTPINTSVTTLEDSDSDGWQDNDGGHRKSSADTAALLPVVNFPGDSGNLVDGNTVVPRRRVSLISETDFALRAGRHGSMSNLGHRASIVEANVPALTEKAPAQNTRPAKKLGWLKNTMQEVYHLMSQQRMDNLKLLVQEPNFTNFTPKDILRGRYDLVSTLREWTLWNLSRQKQYKGLEPSLCDSIYHHFQNRFGIRKLVDQAVHDLIAAIQNYENKDPDVDLFRDLISETRPEFDIGFYLYCRESIHSQIFFFQRKPAAASGAALGADSSAVEKVELEVALKLAKKIFRFEQEEQLLKEDPNHYFGSFSCFLPSQVFQQFYLLLQTYGHPLSTSQRVGKTQPPVASKQSRRPTAQFPSKRRESRRPTSTLFGSTQTESSDTASGAPRKSMGDTSNVATGKKYVAFTDFIHLLFRFRAEYHSRMMKLYWCRSQFSNHDANHDEFITLPEFAQTFSSVYSAPSARELSKIFTNCIRQLGAEEMSYRVYVQTIFNLIKNGVVQLNSLGGTNVDDPKSKGVKNLADLVVQDDKSIEPTYSKDQIEQARAQMQSLTSKWTEILPLVRKKLDELQTYQNGRYFVQASELYQLILKFEKALFIKDTSDYIVSATDTAIRLYRKILCQLLALDINTGYQQSNITSIGAQLDCLQSAFSLPL